MIKAGLMVEVVEAATAVPVVFVPVVPAIVPLEVVPVPVPPGVTLDELVPVGPTGPETGALRLLELIICWHAVEEDRANVFAIVPLLLTVSFWIQFWKLIEHVRFLRLAVLYPPRAQLGTHCGLAAKNCCNATGMVLLGGTGTMQEQRFSVGFAAHTDPTSESNRPEFAIKKL